MGGHGSGVRPTSRRHKVEQCVRLNLLQFRKTGTRAIVPGYRAVGQCELPIPYRDETLAVSFVFDAASPEPSYTFTYQPAGGDPVTVTGALTWGLSSAALDLFMACPECHRQCRLLCLPPNATTFACRLCHDLRYSSEPMADRGRLERRAARFYRLAATAKQRGTLERYLARAAEYERRAWALAAVPRALAGANSPIASPDAIR